MGLSAALFGVVGVGVDTSVGGFAGVSFGVDASSDDSFETANG